MGKEGVSKEGEGKEGEGKERVGKEQSLAAIRTESAKLQQQNQSMTDEVSSASGWARKG